MFIEYLEDLNKDTQIALLRHENKKLKARLAKKHKNRFWGVLARIRRYV